MRGLESVHVCVRFHNNLQWQTILRDDENADIAKQKGHFQGNLDNNYLYTMSNQKIPYHLKHFEHSSWVVVGLW